MLFFSFCLEVLYKNSVPITEEEGGGWWGGETQTPTTHKSRSSFHLPELPFPFSE